MLKIGILGAARIAPLAMIEPAQRRDDVQIQAIAAARPGAAEKYAARYKIDDFYTNYEALIDNANVDLIYIALPPNLHATYTIKALRAGKHVLCEKPFALSVDEVHKMQAAADATGKRLFEAFHNCYHPLFDAVLKVKNSGRLGDITSVRANFSHHIPFVKGEFRHQKHAGGGALMDLGCYPLHWARNIMGEEPRIKSADIRLNQQGVDVQTRAQLVFSNNVPCLIETSMDEGFEHHQIFELFGTQGMLKIYGAVLPQLGHYVLQKTGDITRHFTVAGNTSFDHQLDAIVSSMHNNTPLRSEGSDIIGNMTAIQAIFDAAGS